MSTMKPHPSTLFKAGVSQLILICKYLSAAKVEDIVILVASVSFQLLNDILYLCDLGVCKLRQKLTLIEGKLEHPRHH